MSEISRFDLFQYLKNHQHNLEVLKDEINNLSGDIQDLATQGLFDDREPKFTDNELEILKKSMLRNISIIELENSPKLLIKNGDETILTISNRPTSGREFRGNLFKDFINQSKKEDKNQSLHQALEKVAGNLDFNASLKGSAAATYQNFLADLDLNPRSPLIIYLVENYNKIILNAVKKILNDGNSKNADATLLLKLIEKNSNDSFSKAFKMIGTLEINSFDLIKDALEAMPKASFDTFIRNIGGLSEVQTQQFLQIISDFNFSDELKLFINVSSQLSQNQFIDFMKLLTSSSDSQSLLNKLDNAKSTTERHEILNRPFDIGSQKFNKLIHSKSQAPDPDSDSDPNSKVISTLKSLERPPPEFFLAMKAIVPKHSEVFLKQCVGMDENALIHFTKIIAQMPENKVGNYLNALLRYDNLVAVLEEKKDKFEYLPTSDNRYHDAHANIDALTKQLINNKSKYLKGEMRAEKFYKSSIEACEKALESPLKEHRGYKQAIKSIISTIVSIVTLGLANLASKILTGHADFSKTPTDSVQKVSELKKAINQIKLDGNNDEPSSSYNP